MNREQIRHGVYDRLGVDSSDAELPTEVIDRLINDALHYIEVREDWPWLQYPAAPSTPNVPTVANQDTYAMPADWLRVSEVVLIDAGGNKQPLDMYSPRELDDRWPSSETGMPQEWAIYGDQLMVRPVPDGVYQLIVRYIRREPDLLDDAQVPLMPNSFHAAICEIAAWMAFRRSSQDERATDCWEAWQQWEAQMVGHRRRFRGPSRVRVRPGGYPG